MHLFICAWAWPLLAGVWRAIEPLMKPWCAEGVLPTAANLNLYRRWKSCVGWHCDDEPLFGKCGDAKLIVSVSLGNFALFRWRRQSCSSDEGRSCRLDHGDVLVMDGQCQGEFHHRTSPGREQERINITFRWVKHHVSSCPLLKAGVACCLPTCAKGSSVPVMGNIVNDVSWVWWFLHGVLCIWGALVLLVSLLCTRLGLHWCASCSTRPLGGGRWGHYLCNLWGEYFKIQKMSAFFWIYVGFLIWKPYMLALVGQPSLHGCDACMVYWIKGALRRNCRLKQCETSVSPYWVFLFSRNPTKRFWGLILWHFWAGRARHPGPPSQHHSVSLEFFNVGGWLTHGDLALDAGVDFLAVAEHRLIPARVRSEWSRLKGKGLSSIWAPASQDSSHVGNAGVGVVSLRGAPLALPTFVTAQFKSFFDCGRAVRCLLPLASGRFLHLCVLYGYQGADTDPEQLALTDQLFDAALGELYVAALGQPCLMVGDFNVEPTKIPCLAKGISAGLWVDFGEAWAIAAGLQPSPSCKRSWTAACGRRRDFILGCPLAAAAILSCKVQGCLGCSACSLYPSLACFLVAYC